MIKIKKILGKKNFKKLATNGIGIGEERIINLKYKQDEILKNYD